MQKDLLEITDLSPEDIKKIIDLAFDYKKKYDEGVRKEDILNGTPIALVFEKPSLRTKTSFEVATAYLGGTPIFLTGSQIFACGDDAHGRESIPDVARNLERFTDLIMARVYKHEALVELGKSTKKPVINLLCDNHHPTQALADLMVFMWHNQDWQNGKISFIGDSNNVALSLAQICALMGINFAIASPEGFQFSEETKQALKSIAKAGMDFYTDPKEALKDADAVYADTFVSMGEEGKKSTDAFEGYQINKDLLTSAKENTLFMHCLPAHRGSEVTDEVMDSDKSIVFDQAECRMHIAKSLITIYLNKA